MSGIVDTVFQAAVNDIQASVFQLMPPIPWAIGTLIAIWLLIRVRPPVKVMGIVLALPYLFVYAAWQSVLPIIT